MKLQNACILSKTLNGVTYSDTGDFAKALLQKSNFLTADIYVQNKKVLSTRANFREDNAWVVCWIDGRFSITPQQWYNNVYIVVSDKEGNVILESDTDMLDVVLLSGDIDVDLSFIVTSTVSGCTAPIYLPESRFVKATLNKLTPVEWDTLDPSPKPDPEPEPQPQPTPSVEPDGSLMLTALREGSTVGFVKLNTSNSYQYQLLDAADSTEWTDITDSSLSLSLGVGKRVQFRCTKFTENTDSNYTQFKMTGMFSADGSAASMYDPNYNTDSATDTAPAYGLYYLFASCSGLTTAPALPATTLADYCYSEMFYETFIKTAPELPATTLAPHCYESMFSACASLSEAPELPAQELAPYCYQGMFLCCIQLLKAPQLPARKLSEWCYSNMFSTCLLLQDLPELPAQELAPYCYQGMFIGCVYMKNYPELPATTLAEGCYCQMFYCANSMNLSESVALPKLPAKELTDYCYYYMFCKNNIPNGSAPELPATTLAKGCYSCMFIDCPSLKTAPKLPSKELKLDCYSNMFSGCSSIKEIYCDASSDMPITISSITDPSPMSLCSVLTYGIDDNEGVLHLSEEYVNNYEESIKSYKENGGKWKVYPYDQPVEADGSLMLTALEDNCEIGFMQINPDNTYEYQLLDDENNKEWTPFNDTKLKIKLNRGQRAQFRCTDFNSNSNTKHFNFIFKSLVAASGSVASMYDPNYNTDSATDVVPDYGCYRLFNDCIGLTTAPELPAKETLLHAYEEMFCRCRSLLAVPDLSSLKVLDDYCCCRMFFACTSIKSPATIELNNEHGLFKHCYEEMYDHCISLQEPTPISVGNGSLDEYCCKRMYAGCSNLTSDIEPLFFDTTVVKSLAEGCFEGMFSGCTSITRPLVTTDRNEMTLGWATLAPRCYLEMYNDCTSLEYTPTLTAGKLENSCYESMFFGCSHLETTPFLPASDLADRCYANMFGNCSWITEAPELGATTAKSQCYDGIISGTEVSEIYLNFKTADSAEILYSVINDITAGGTTWDKAGTLYVTDEFLAYNPEEFLKYYNQYREDGGTWHIYPYDKLAEPDGSLCFMGLNETNKISLLARGTVTNKYQYQLLDDDNKYFPWTDYTLGTEIALDRGKRVQFRCTEFNGNTSSNYVQFKSDLKSSLSISGFALSMYSDDYKRSDPESVAAPEYACYRLFYGCTAISAIDTVLKMLPSITVGKYSYKEMFYGCTGLSQAPVLPAETLAESCYESMFAGCTSIATIPELCAQTLAKSCYKQMFADCIALDYLKQLPATTLAESCYEDMFLRCSSLKLEQDSTENKLPAKELAKNCYKEMFKWCASLFVTPELPAQTLAESCYEGMFFGCNNLYYVPKLPATTLAKNCYSDMFRNCTALNEGISMDTSGNSVIPLVAETLAESCYCRMFRGCTSLTKVDLMAASILAPSCCQQMFYGCSSLVEAVELKATQLYTDCYKQMFNGCSSLKEIHCSATDDNTTDKSLIKSLCSTLTEGINDNEGILHLSEEYVNNYEESIKSYKENGGKWKVYPYNEPAVKDGSLMFTALEDNCEIGFAKINPDNTYEYQLLDDPDNPRWQVISDTNTVISLSAHQRAQFKCTNYTANNASKYIQFKLTGLFTASGNVASMYDVNFDNDSRRTDCPDYACYYMFYGCTSFITAPKLPATTLKPNCYHSMFYGCTSLTSAPKLPATTLGVSCYCSMFRNCKSLTSAPELPATTLAVGCYYSMFYGCTSLTSAPKLPSTTLAMGCYNSMFSRCTSLTSAPELPAETLVPDCYNSMFSKCTSLTSAPELPATTLDVSCYYSMFYGCTSLTSAPKLPSTTLAMGCYNSMFSRCTSLTSAPELPAETLTEGCYNSMFSRCTSLNKVYCAATTTATDALSNWLSNVASTGDIYLNESATIFQTDSDSGIPTGWTRHPLSDWPSA